MVLIGVAGWSYDDWVGTVYPRRRPTGFHPLTYLARYVDCMEINSSFYALPRAEHARRWVGCVEPYVGFRFTVKLHRSFTHGRVEEITRQTATAFREGIAPLVEAGRLLALLVQFPVSFRENASAWRRIETIRALFPDVHPVLELRHRSFFDERSLARLTDLDVGLVHIDLPPARDHPPADHPSLGPLGYLRLHGRNRKTWFDGRSGRNARYDYRYDAKEIEDVRTRLETLAGRTERTLLIANNHFRGQAVANAIQLKSLFAQRPVPAPPDLLATYPDLGPYVLPEGQLSLF